MSQQDVKKWEMLQKLKALGIKVEAGEPNFAKGEYSGGLKNQEGNKKLVLK